MALAHGDADAARRHFDQAAEAWREGGDEPALVRALNLSGWSALEAGDYASAEAALHDAMVRARVVGDDASLSNVLHSHGEMLRRQGNLDVAQAELEESLLLARTAGWRTQLWWPTWSLAAVAREQGRLEDAEELIDHAEALVPRINRSMRLADCKDERALIASARGDEIAAQKWRDEAAMLRSEATARSSAEG
jgi:tetratricopeptide (TPR) repeat protein